MHTALRRTRITAALASALLLIGIAAPAQAAPTAVTAASFWSSSKVHSISVTFAKADFTKLLSTYKATGTKSWMKAAVKLDGRTFTDVGMRLKGNSSLRSVTTSATAQSLPWLVRLDKYNKAQNLNGMTAFVIRSNVTATSLNEAVALELIGAAGLETQRAIATKLSVNGSKPTLRLVIENPDDYWYSKTFADSGLLYKADAAGDYSYRGESATAYVDVFDQETSKKSDNLAPLTAFLKFINQSSDSAFAAELSGYLDVEKFAKYLAIQDLLDNFDDIEGPGNNSYLQYSYATKRMTVVSWDQNLSFGQTPGAGGQPGGGPGGGLPGGGGQPGGNPPPGAPGQNPRAGGPGGKGMSGNNILATRFKANAAFAKLVTQATTTLQTQLYGSGLAGKTLTRWANLLKAQASGTVTTAKINAEAAAIRKYFV